MKQEAYIVEEDGIRIDKYLSEITNFSRSRIQQLIEQEEVAVNGEAVRSSYKVCEGDEIVIRIPDAQVVDVLAEDIPLDVLYEDEDLIVVNKPKGMMAHPATGIYQGTLVNALLFHCKDLSGINGELRPGIVHRIDKDTTGCIIACKNDFAHEAIAKQIENKTCYREYVAIVEGILDHDDGLIDAPIGRDPIDRQKMMVTDKNSKQAKTHFHVLERFNHYTYVSCVLETGRTHQIRVHMKYIHHPVVGDTKYGKACEFMDTHGQVLHARTIQFIHPRTNQEMKFTAPLPAYFEELLDRLHQQEGIE